MNSFKIVIILFLFSDSTYASRGELSIDSTAKRVLKPRRVEVSIISPEEVLMKRVEAINIKNMKDDEILEEYANSGSYKTEYCLRASVGKINTGGLKFFKFILPIGLENKIGVNNKLRVEEVMIARCGAIRKYRNRLRHEAKRRGIYPNYKKRGALI